MQAGGVGTSPGPVHTLDDDGVLDLVVLARNAWGHQMENVCHRQGTPPPLRMVSADRSLPPAISTGQRMY